MTVSYTHLDVYKRQTKAVSEDIESISELYDAVNTYFSDNVNYCFPNWQKGKYPVRRDALEALQKDTLLVLKFSGKMEGDVYKRQAYS